MRGRVASIYYTQVLSFKNVLNRSKIGILKKTKRQSIGNDDTNSHTKFHRGSSIGD